MSTRYTKADARRAVVRMAAAAESADVDTSGWALSPGSSSNGTAWVLHSADAPVPYLGWFGNIGRTASEATRTLDAMAAAFDLAARYRED